MLVTRVIGDCPGCKGPACFGNVDVYRDHVLRGCRYCKYSTSVYLPPIRKAVLYLDQFFFSGAFRGGDARFVTAANRIKDLTAKQLLVVPFSSIHEDETHQWDRRAELPPFAQVIADMGRLGSIGSRRRSVCAHGEKPSTRISGVPLPLR